MTEPVPAGSDPAAPVKKRRWLKVSLLILLILAVLFYLFTFFGLNYFGEKFLRNYLRERILKSSNGLYTADFRRMNFNIITGKISIDSFELIPDTLRYQELKASGKVARSLYRASFESLIIDRLHAWQIYTQKRIKFRQISLVRPEISIVGFPDTVTAQKGRFRIIYEDIYPAISQVFNDFHVDSVKLDQGTLTTSFLQKTGKHSEGIYHFSAVLRDVSVNPFSYYNRKRVFYSRDIDWVIYNFEYALADSLYILHADEAGFSLSRSILSGKNISLRPRKSAIIASRAGKGDFFELNLPAFSIDGINLYEVLVDKRVEINQVLLNHLTMKLFHHQGGLEKASPAPKKKKPRITLAGLYTVISGVLRDISIDTIDLSDASFEYYGSLFQQRPEMKIREVDLSLSHFYLDSLAWLNHNKIFYSDDVELELKGFDLKLKDQIHTLTARKISFSTRKSMIRLNDGQIYPDTRRNEMLSEGQQNTIDFRLPEMTFRNIDLKKFFNRRILKFNLLDIREPDLKVIRYRAPRNKSPRFSKARDFFEEHNEDVVYNLLKKYVYSIHGEEIRISRGYSQVTRNQNGIERKIAAASFDLSMQQFLIDSVHGLNQQGYFYSRDFDLDLRSVTMESPDSLRRLSINHLQVITADSLIRAEDIRIERLGPPSGQPFTRKARSQLTVSFTLDRLLLTGLNHKKLFLEKILKANHIIFENPMLALKTEPLAVTDTIDEEHNLLPAEDPVRNFEIGKLLVKKGTFSYNGQEDRRASYFTLKDIDFSVVNARVRLPKKNQHDGLIRFDSLQLFVLPLRAALADSTYQLEISALGVDSYPAKIIAQGVKVYPLTPARSPADTLPRFSVEIPEIKIGGFYFDKAIFDKEWTFSRIILEEPHLFVEMNKKALSSKKGVERKIQPSVTIPPMMNILKIASLKINEASVAVDVRDKDSVRSFELGQIDIDVKKFLVDPQTRLHPDTNHLFNTEEITLSAPGFQGVTADSLYTWRFARFGFSTATRKAYADSVELIPNYDRVQFSWKKGCQTDRFVLRIPKVELNRINFRNLVLNRTLTAGTLALTGMQFEGYRDKRVAFPKWQRPPLPRQMYRKMTFPLQLDTLRVYDAAASYEEQVGDEPGRLWFERMNFELTGIKPGTSMVDMKGSACLMGQGQVDADFRFFMEHPRDSMIVKATIRELNMPAINPMLARLVPASITAGYLQKLEVDPIWMNDSIAVGHLVMYYDGLAVRLRPTGSGTWDRIRTNLLSELVNLLLPEQNPADNKRLRSGTILFERDRSKGFFNFLWKSVLSGIKSNMGFNTKPQKERIKQENKSRK